MKGLTPEEYAALVYIRDHTVCHTGARNTTVAPAATRIDLREQGRTALVPCPCHGITMSVITPSGREALRLYPLVHALEER